MLFIRLTFLAFLLSNTGMLFSQCTPDETFVPVGTNYGLSPDTLSDGVVNQPYYQELTFYLPLDTLVDVEGFGETLIDFEDYHITSITLPVGSVGNVTTAMITVTQSNHYTIWVSVSLVCL